MQATVYHKGKHLEPDEIYLAADSCPLCLDPAPRTQVACLQHDPAVHLLQCRTCGGMSASHMPKPAVLAQYYREYYAARAGKPCVTIDDVQDFGKWVARLVQRARKTGAAGGTFRILDFGGGDGSLSIAIANLLQLPCAITVIDISPVARIDCPHTVTYVPDLFAVDDTFDLVIASAVLEHIPDCRPVFLKLWELVGSGGCFYARTPYIFPFIKIFPKMDFTYPGHVHDLGPAFWNRVIETFALQAEIVASQPTRSETGFRQHFFRTLLVNALKAPARLEVHWRGFPRQLIWPYVGGWEMVLRKS